MTVESQKNFGEENTEIDVTATGSLIAYNETKRAFQQERILFSLVKNVKLKKKLMCFKMFFQFPTQ